MDSCFARNKGKLLGLGAGFWIRSDCLGIQLRSVGTELPPSSQCQSRTESEDPILYELQKCLIGKWGPDPTRLVPGVLCDDDDCKIWGFFFFNRDKEQNENSGMKKMKPGTQNIRHSWRETWEPGRLEEKCLEKGAQTVRRQRGYSKKIWHTCSFGAHKEENKADAACKEVMPDMFLKTDGSASHEFWKHHTQRGKYKERYTPKTAANQTRTAQRL